MRLGDILKFALAVSVMSMHATPVFSQPSVSKDSDSESTANTQTIPAQILKTGVVLTSEGISANSLQLANSIGLSAIMVLREGVVALEKTQGLARVMAKQELSDELQKALLLIQRTSLEVDFAVAEIEAEHQVYEEILSTFINDRDKRIARTNAASFISNGALWAVCEALAIPSYKNSKFAIPSGIIGIPAGVVPSIASMWTLRQVNGKKMNSEVEPNMLAKLFGYSTNPEIEYPRSVWDFLNQVPAENPKGKKRLDQLIDRWIADSNMPAFTDRHSKKQLDILTSSFSQRKGLSIATLTARSVMLQQLHSEIWKMKRMLLELNMAVDGMKQITAYDPSNAGDISAR